MAASRTTKDLDASEAFTPSTALLGHSIDEAAASAKPAKGDQRRAPRNPTRGDNGRL